ncbi:Uncharacterised protein [Bacillus freudenreichii]|nr:Uncharacterised protein [Bacillus freudenreichii]
MLLFIILAVAALIGIRYGIVKKNKILVIVLIILLIFIAIIFLAYSFIYIKPLLN